MLKVSNIMKVILVVDEDPANLNLLRNLLEEPRRIVITQRSCIEAMRLIHIGMHVDAAVVNDGMRKTEIINLFIALRRLVPAVPFILMLTPGSDTECLKNLSQGKFECVEKPIVTANLKRMVDKVIDSQKALIRYPDLYSRHVLR